MCSVVAQKSPWLWVASAMVDMWAWPGLSLGGQRKENCREATEELCITSLHAFLHPVRPEVMSEDRASRFSPPCVGLRGKRGLPGKRGLHGRK